MNTATPTATTSEPSAPSEATLTARAEILRQIRQAPRVMICIRINDGSGNGSGHMWLGKQQALALIDSGELDGFAALLLNPDLLILNHDYSWTLRDEHKTDRYRALVKLAAKQGHAVGAHITAFLAKRDAAVPANIRETPAQAPGQTLLVGSGQTSVAA